MELASHKSGNRSDQDARCPDKSTVFACNTVLQE
jgi:hypothetical protein